MSVEIDVAVDRIEYVNIHSFDAEVFRAMLRTELIAAEQRGAAAAAERASQWSEIAGEHGAEVDRLRASLREAAQMARAFLDDIRDFLRDLANEK